MSEDLLMLKKIQKKLGKVEKTYGDADLLAKEQQNNKQEEQQKNDVAVKSKRASPFQCAHELRPGVVCGKGSYSKYCYAHKKLKCHSQEVTQAEESTDNK